MYKLTNEDSFKYINILKFFFFIYFALKPSRTLWIIMLTNHEIQKIMWNFIIFFMFYYQWIYQIIYSHSQTLSKLQFIWRNLQHFKKVLYVLNFLYLFEEWYFSKELVLIYRSSFVVCLMLSCAFAYTRGKLACFYCSTYFKALSSSSTNDQVFVYACIIVRLTSTVNFVFFHNGKPNDTLIRFLCKLRNK